MKTLVDSQPLVISNSGIHSHLCINHNIIYFYSLDEPIEVRGGDELLTTCYYSSKSTDSFTYYGQETNDEMCFAIVTYYPKENLGNICHIS